MKKPEIMIGGQALIEGVMMRGPGGIGMACRKESGDIVTRVDNLKKPNKFWKLPFFRGMYGLATMLVIGIRSLNWSAAQSLEEEENVSDWMLYLTVAFSIVFGIALFVGLPYALTFVAGFTEEQTPVLFNFVDGIIKVAILILYVWGIGLMHDIKRLYQYHGAEHKTVHCYENDLPLTVENVQKFSRLHPRCGTSFLFITIIVSIFVFSFTPILMELIYPAINELGFWLRRVIYFIFRLALLPVVAGISYEFLKWSANYVDHPILKALVMPGMMLQKITTNEPQNDQVEVAIKSLQLVTTQQKI